MVISHRPPWPCAPAWSWVVIFLALHVLSAVSVRNIIIPNTSPQVVYTPFLCNITRTASELNQNASCNGAWRTSNVAGTTLVTTNGPSPETGDLVPQMFLRIRASSLIMTTSIRSNATANLTLSAGGLSVSAQINSSIGIIAAVNLIETEITLLSVSFVSNSTPSRLDISFLNITVSDNNATSSSFLPSQRLPSSTPPPSFSIPTMTPTSSASPSASVIATLRSPHRVMIAQAVGLTVGLGLGLTTLSLLSFMCWRRRMRLKSPHLNSEAYSAPSRAPARP